MLITSYTTFFKGRGKGRCKVKDQEALVNRDHKLHHLLQATLGLRHPAATVRSLTEPRFLCKKENETESLDGLSGEREKLTFQVTSF